MANQSIYSAFERMWQHIVAAIGNKADKTHVHDDRYYTEEEIDGALANFTNGTVTVKEAEHAASANTATSATNANHAITADSAVSADSATKATQDANGNVITSTYETKADATTKLSEAKAYTDEKTNVLASTSSVNTSISTHNTSTEAHNDIRVLISQLSTKVNNFLDVDDTKTDELSEILTLINNNKGTLESLTTTKVNVSDIVNNLTTNSDKKVLSAAQGVALKGLIDALQTAVDTHDADTTKHITSTERTNWNAAKTHADSAHAPSNAEKNQNAFSNIAVSGQTTVAADSATDTITFAGSNVSITTDATNDKVTFTVADASTSAKGVVQLSDSTSSDVSTTAATSKAVKAAYDLANTAKTNAATAQTKADSAYSLAESKVDSLSDLGITAAVTELNYMDGVTSGVQAQLDSKMNAANPTGTGSFSMNRKAGTTVGTNSHTEGLDTTASGNYSHAEGGSTTASGRYAHAEGYTTTAGEVAHAEGDESIADGWGSHAEGYLTIAAGDYQHVQGMCNIEDSDGDYAHIVGNGDSDDVRSNAHTLDWDGNAWFSGDVYTGSTSGTNKDSGSKKLATEDYVTSVIGNITHPVTSVNGKTGAVSLAAEDVGALSATNPELTDGNYLTVVSSEGASTELNAAHLYLDTNDSEYPGSTFIAINYINFSDNAGKISNLSAPINDNDAANKAYVDSKAVTVDTALSSTSTNPVQNKVVNTALSGKVPTSRTINGKALSSNITLSAADVGARASTWTPTASDVGAVPTTRKVNGKALSADITLSASDVGARPSTWTPTASDVGALPVENPEFSGTLKGQSGASVSITSSDYSQTNISGGRIELYDDTYQVVIDTTSISFPEIAMEEYAGKIRGLAAPTSDTDAANKEYVDSVVGSKVPTSRTINGKALSANISLTASDVGAAPAYTYGTTDLTAGTSALETGKLYFVYE